MVNDENGAVPPRGWELPPEDAAQAAGDSARATDHDPLAQLIEQLLVLVPDDLRLRLTAAVRQLLEALRALIDWCVSRLERRAETRVEVRDIPIL